MQTEYVALTAETVVLVAEAQAGVALAAAGNFLIRRRPK